MEAQVTIKATPGELDLLVRALAHLELELEEKITVDRQLEPGRVKDHREQLAQVKLLYSKLT